MRKRCSFDIAARLVLAFVAALLMSGAVRAAPPPASDSSAPAVVVLRADGQVRVVRGGSGRIQPAMAGMRLEPGDRLETGTNSQATLNWYDRAVMPVGELTRLLITPPRGAGKRPGFSLLQGLLYFFHRDKPQETEAQAPGVWAVILGTEFSMRVEENGRATLNLFDGDVELSAAQGGRLHLRSGEQGVVEPGQPPRKTSVLVAGTELIQWFLYYPGILDLAELELTAEEKELLGDSLSAYRDGDLPEALALYPIGRQPVSPSEKIYVAAVLLAAGQADKSERLLASVDDAIGTGHRLGGLTAGLRALIAVVQGRSTTAPLDESLATALIAESYRRQAQADITNALAAATSAVRVSPRFAFGWARVAELEFSIGRGQRAKQAVDESLQLAPSNAQALALRGFLLAAEDKFKAALDAFEEAIVADSALGNAWLGRGLCRIRQGDSAAGREDLMVAAALEPQRALLRSYLGKAFGHDGQAREALRELELARRLDANDPTGWLYSALLLQELNRINEAVRDLERSTELNDHRRLYRSRLLLEQDRAVRGANLAGVYLDAGMTDVSFREAASAVAADYANYSAHLFLANSYNQLRDPKQVNLRYETPWLSEFLVAKLLAPVDAGALSQTISQQEYARLFEQDRLGVVSRTDYFSNGDLAVAGAQFGRLGGLAYSLDALYRSQNGQRLNNDLDQLTLSFQAKQRVTARDEVYIQSVYYRAEAGDLAQYYDPDDASRTLRSKETQTPLLLGGWHHTWSPGVHTLLLAGRLEDTLRVTNNGYPLLLQGRDTNWAITDMGYFPRPLQYRNELEIYTVEAQQLWQRAGNTFIGGARYQAGEFEARDRIRGLVFIPTTATNVEPGFDRLAVYGYYHRQVVEPLMLIAGVTYDRLTFPENVRFPPLFGGEETTDRVSPKVGLVWTPGPATTVRGAWTRSLGGASIDQSFQLEPAQVAGFSQVFRSLVPESAAGALAGARHETRGLALEHKLKTDTYLGLSAEWLLSEGGRSVGMLVRTQAMFADVYSPAKARERIEFEEQAVAITLNQLIGQEWAFGARYRLSRAELSGRFAGVPDGIEERGGFLREQDREAVLHQLEFRAIYQNAAGFFAEGQALWWSQHNAGDDSALRGDQFWQFNVFAGYRFPRRRAEVRVGLLNVTDQDYRLNPLSLTAELPRERTFTASFQFNF